MFNPGSPRVLHDNSGGQQIWCNSRADGYSPDGRVSIEAATGVSARDRVKTVQAAIADNAGPGDINRPGHVFPLKATKTGQPVVHVPGKIKLQKERKSKTGNKIALGISVNLKNLKFCLLLSITHQ